MKNCNKYLPVFIEIILSKTRNKAVTIKITTATVARVSIPFKDR